MQLVLGTHNRKKGLELAELLQPYGFEIVTLADLPNSIEVEETGDTFTANAALKACEQAKHLNRWVLGEDSGLAVDALKGGPGVYSARFSGPAATDESNNQLLLEKLANTPLEKRTRTLRLPCNALRPRRQRSSRVRRLLSWPHPLRIRRCQRLRLRPALRSHRISSHVWRTRPHSQSRPQPRAPGQSAN